ncbi:hypothetical protein PMKS-001906 [Pichia membranifaciens]|uniref:Anaphase-promoting complex subunit 4 WD40 domain-containing protein n=1 Tax=Pichia membranifaciens TaxID=4926 RepID=A0A1Q2YG35_9ASCO|nr:hypothetical protein PMKS-001906 [Pichia membranifaciens]
MTHGTVRAWDSRSDKCYACLSNMGDSPIIALDRSGTILAVWHQNKSTVYLVPLESFPIGVIGEIKVPKRPSERIEKLVWADKGLLILDPPGHDKIVIDTIKLIVAGTLSGVTPFAISSQSDDAARSGSMDVTPDGYWCLSGSGDGSVLAWNLSTFFSSGGRIPSVQPIRIGNNELVNRQVVPRILTVNPKLGTVVTGDTEIVISIYNKKE